MNLNEEARDAVKQFIIHQIQDEGSEFWEEMGEDMQHLTDEEWDIFVKNILAVKVNVL